MILVTAPRLQLLFLEIFPWMRVQGREWPGHIKQNITRMKGWMTINSFIVVNPWMPVHPWIPQQPVYSHIGWKLKLFNIHVLKHRLLKWEDCWHSITRRGTWVQWGFWRCLLKVYNSWTVWLIYTKFSGIMDNISLVKIVHSCSNNVLY